MQLSTNVSAAISVLAGAWTLVNQTLQEPNGTQLPLSDHGAGASPSGMIIYTSTGYMAANIMSTRPQDRPENLTYPDKDSDADSDWALVGRHTLSYAGPVTVDPWNKTHGSLIHGPLSFAVVPSLVETSQLRNYSLSEDAMYLTLIAKNNTNGQEGHLVWKRNVQSWS